MPASRFGTPRKYPCASTLRSNSFSFTHFRKNASATPLVSHTFKTKDLKPFRFTHFQKKVGGGVPLYVRASVPNHRSAITTKHHSPVTRELPHMTPGAIIQFHTPPHSWARSVWGMLLACVIFGSKNASPPLVRMAA